MRSILIWRLLVLFLVFLFGGLGSHSLAQTPSIHKYTLSEGLPQMQVMSMMQDSKGYIWIVTKNGLSKFDGIDFVNYYSKDGLLNDYCLGVYEDPHGDIWVIDEKGVVKYNGHSFDFVFGPEDFGLVRFYNCIVMFDNGDLLIGAKNSEDIRGVYRIDPLTKGLKQEQIIKDKSYWLFSKSQINNNIYLWTSKKLYRWFPDGFKVIFEGGGSSFHKDFEHFLRFSDDQYATFVNDTIQLFPYKPQRVDYVDHPYTSSMKNDSLYLYGKETYTVIPWRYGWVNGIFIDRDGMLYIHGEDGLYKILSDAFLNFNPISPGVNKNIWSVVEDTRGRIWFNSIFGTIQAWDGKTLQNIDYLSDLDWKGFYMGSTRLANGDLLLTHSDGLIKYDGQRFSNVDWVNSQTLLAWQNPQNNDILVSDCSRGLLINDGKSISRFSEFNDQEIGFISDMCVDRDGIYWIATGFTIVRHNGDSTIFFDEGTVPIAHGRGIVCDASNRIWAGGNEGLFWYDYNTERFISALPEEENSSIQFIEVMNDTAILVGRYGNILIVNLPEFNEYLQNPDRSQPLPWLVLGKSDGFFGGETDQKGVWKDSKGYFWINGSDGVVRFDPRLINKSPIPPKVHITQITAYNSLTNARKTAFLNQYGTSNDKEIQFTHDLPNVRVDLDAISTINPDKLQIQYRLVKQEWVASDNNNSISISALKPGTYNLEVRAGRSDKLWSEPANISFSVLPAFWQTLLFKVGCVVFLIGIFYFGIQYRSRKVLKKEKQKQTYLAEINNLKLKSLQTQMNPHFVSNALNSIQYYVLQNDLRGSVKYIQNFGKLLRLTLDTVALDTHALMDEIQYLESYIQVENNRLEQKIDYHFIMGHDLQPDQLEIPVMMIQPFVENVFKHAFNENNLPDPAIWIRFTALPDGLAVEIEDNGLGIKRVSGNNEAETKEFKSHALRITRERIQALNANGNSHYQVQITPANEKRGTLVKIVIPVTKKNVFEPINN